MSGIDRSGIDRSGRVSSVAVSSVSSEESSVAVAVESLPAVLSAGASVAGEVSAVDTEAGTDSRSPDSPAVTPASSLLQPAARSRSALIAAAVMVRLMPATRMRRAAHRTVARSSDGRPGRAAGADVRIRWSNALSAAVEPAPIAMTICLNGTVVQSPAANTPGTDVWPRSSITISPRGDSSTRAAQPLGVRQQPDLDEDAVDVEPVASSRRCGRCRSSPVSLLPSPTDLGGQRADDDVDVRQAAQLALQHLVGAQLRRRTRSA